MTMKRVFLIVVLIMIFGKQFSQITKQPRVSPISQGRIFDTLFDRFGKKYSLDDIRLGANPSMNTNTQGKGYSENQTTTVPSQSCSAGYFNLYFSTGSYYDGNTSAQNALCQLFTDVTGFINSSLSPVSGIGVKVNILCRNTPTSVPNALAAASSFYSLPLSPTNPNQGIIDNQIQKTIITGADPFAGLPIALFPGASNFYHGYIETNPNPLGGVWNTNLSSITIGAGNYDFYTIMLHEVVHALGFASLISSSGTSVFGASNNYYSRYDQYLTNSAGTPLITSSTPSCSSSNMYFQGTTTDIAPGNTSCITDVSTCSLAAQYLGSTNAKVYTPSCFEQGSSLSHFEDMCSTPIGFSSPCYSGSFNNLYFVMANASITGNCSVKRHLTEMEKYVLCNLGYSVNVTYTSTAAGATYTYANSCAGTNVWGVNDGLVNNIYTYSTTSSSTVIPLASILSNDAPGAQVSCVEALYSNYTAIAGASNLTVTALSGFVGLAVIKYVPKNGSVFGNATYVYVYFIPTNCNPPNSCNMIQNGSFEFTSSLSLYQCGEIDTDCILSCWAGAGGTPDVHTRSCTSIGAHELLVNTANSSPPMDSYNGAPNNKIIGLGGNGAGYECIKNNLSSPLIPGQTYQISFVVSSSYDPWQNGLPIVVSVASAPNFASFVPFPFVPSSLDILTEFTVNTSASVWSPVTNTFVFSPSVTANHNAVFFSANGPKLVGLGIITATTPSYYFIDDISLLPYNPSNQLINPQSSNCGINSFSNLAQYAPPFPGTFSGPGVTYSASTGQYSFNAPPTLSPGIYPIAFTYTNNGCINVLWENIHVVDIGITNDANPCSGNHTLTTAGFDSGTTYTWVPGNVNTPSIAINPTSITIYTLYTNNTCPIIYTFTPNPFIQTSPSPTYCSNLGISAIVSATTNPPGGTYTWQPGNLVGQTQSVTPSVNTIYTVNATTNGCSVTKTLSVNVSSVCCPSSTIPVLSTTLITSNTVNGPYQILSDLTISGSSPSYFQNGEFLMAPGVKITVLNGGYLILKSAHIYGCTNMMWEGIEVQNGGIFESSTGSSSMIEDAVTAIKIDNVNSVPTYSLLELNGTIFNKNYVAISINNATTNAVPVFINRCVFTSRSFTFNATQWPGSSTNAPDLRSPTNGTTGLLSPYTLQGAAISNLKPPYNNQPSEIGISITNVGNASGTPSFGVDIGTATSNLDYFNLFDGVGTGIYALNSNVGCFNNVFQNTQTYTVSGQLTGGSAITHSSSSLMNTQLNITNPSSSSQSLNNRFWNCHKGIQGYNIYSLDAQNALFRSNQDVTNTSGFLPGNIGVTLNTSRFTYSLSNNVFNNIDTCIYVTVKTGTYNFGSTQTGLYANGLYINSNWFGPQTSSATTLSNEYLNHAIIIDGSNTSGIQQISSTDLTILSNNINRAYRGIYLDGMQGYPCSINGNRIDLSDDGTFGLLQKGISIKNTQRNVIVTANILSGIAITNTLMNLMYFENNSNAGSSSPSVSCNSLEKAFEGFKFNGSNSGTLWKGNTMKTLSRGLNLTNTGIIGDQGNSTNASDNVWAGNWSAANCTYVDNTSNASSSRLYVRSSTGSYYPINNSGTLNYSIAGNRIICGGGYTPFSCSSLPTLPSMPFFRSASSINNENLEIDGNQNMSEQETRVLNIFPNPNYGKLNIVTGCDIETIHIKVSELSGKILIEKDLTSINHFVTIDVSVDQGMYIVELSNKDVKMVKKIVFIK